MGFQVLSLHAFVFHIPDILVSIKALKQSAVYACSGWGGWKNYISMEK